MVSDKCTVIDQISYDVCDSQLQKQKIIVSTEDKQFIFSLSYKFAKFGAVFCSLLILFFSLYFKLFGF